MNIETIPLTQLVPSATNVRKTGAKDGIEAEVVDPRTLRPLDHQIIVDSVQKTGRCVIVEVGWPVAGFGAEVAYQVQKHCLDALDARRLALGTETHLSAQSNRKEGNLRTSPPIGCP